MEVTMRYRLFSLMTASAIASTAAYAQNASFGTPAEAKAMLERVVISIKADPADQQG